MNIDLEKKSQELKDFVSKYETTKFLGDISNLMRFIRFESPIKSLQGLSSPQRQLLYLGALNITSAIDDTNQKDQYSDEEFEQIKTLLNEIENGYQQFFYPKPDDIIDEEYKNRIMVAMPTFLSYFNQGLLNYEEQIIERIEEYFKPFEKEITNHFKLTIADFIDIYNFIDQVQNNFIDENINRKEGKQTWEEFCNEMKSKGIMPWEWQAHLPQHFQNLFESMHDTGKMHRYSKQSLIDKFGKEKTNSFLDTFTCKRQKTNFLYYTEINILHSQPIFNINDEQFQLIENQQVIQAIYNTLFQFCISQPSLKEKFYAVRGKKLEEKIEKIFQRFFKNKAFVYKSFYTQDKHEQDLLFLHEGLALIVEAKASKRDEPRREPDKAYPLIVSNFEETIQKGYDQAYRVKSKFINKETLKIFQDQNLRNHLIDIRTKNYHKAVSLIVTLERFGQIQTDLSYMLEIYEDDDFPWSICIDDLEVFLLQLEKMGKKKSDLTEFLIIREQLHGRLITGDELEVCGAFLNNKINRKQVADDNVTFLMTPDLADIFDESYHRGLGFDNEKNIEKKKSGKYITFG
ncbi:hypothetical protein [Kaistella carnis]|uniref:hypothetical protein n=1 Tax=Kaistella carnis TaxID=1241979 RepID=UPI0028B13D52|nr:hypothetical protein [Kaistella carnis]